MLAADDERGASTRYRVLAYRPALRAAGFEPTVRFPPSRAARGLPRLVLRSADLMHDVVDGSDARLLFIHRKLYPPPLAPRLRRAGRPLVFDMDDAIDLPPPRKTLSERARRRYLRNFEATVQVADLVLCGNRELVSRLPHGRYELLPTPIDTARFAPDPAAPVAGRRLGWVGHSDNLGYLESLAGALRELAGRHPDLGLVVVADRPPDLPGVRVEFRRWSLDSEVDCFRDIGIGLMPLEDSEWARSKCAFKAIQYMALGIPAVVSPVGMNAEVVRDGRNGFLAQSPEDWVRALDRLLSDRELAARIGGAGRETVVRDYSVDVLSKKLISTLESLAPR